MRLILAAACAVTLAFPAMAAPTTVYFSGVETNAAPLFSLGPVGTFSGSYTFDPTVAGLSSGTGAAITEELYQFDYSTSPFQATLTDDTHSRFYAGTVGFDRIHTTDRQIFGNLSFPLGTQGGQIQIDLSNLGAPAGQPTPPPTSLVLATPDLAAYFGRQFQVEETFQSGTIPQCVDGECIDVPNYVSAFYNGRITSLSLAPPVPVPEPATLSLLGVAAGAAAWVRRRRSRSRRVIDRRHRQRSDVTWF